MKYWLLIGFLAVSGSSALFAQATSGTWNLGWVGTLNGSQATYRNWSQGGVNSVAATGGTRFTAKYSLDRYVFDHSTSLKYGRARLNGNESRKTDDEIRLRNQISRKFGNPSYSLIGQVNFDTQFDDGYDKNYVNVVSTFFAPAYVTETIGFAYAPDKTMQFNAGLSLKQTIVVDTLLTARYGLKDDARFRNEGGVSFGYRITRPLATNLNYTGAFDTFTNLHRPLSSTVIKIDNNLVGKINSFLSANVQFAMIYDDNVIKEWQVKQVLSIGFSYTIL